MTLPPDSFTGTLLSLEGISDAQVILNGPTGCKFYHAHISDRQFLRSLPRIPVSDYSLGQARIPCTFLDSDDYTTGSAQKNQWILPALAANHPGLIIIVNSPGAALIGDDLDHFIASAGLGHRCFAIETTPASRPASEGFTGAALQVLRYLSLEKQDPIPKKVNLVGISLLQKYWEGDIAEIKRLLALMGVEVGATLVAGSSADDLRRSADASCNLILCSEYGRDLAQWYKSEYQIPFVILPEGAPIGFDATGQWVQETADMLGVDPAPALLDIRRARERAYRQLMYARHQSGIPKGATFAIAADSSLALPLTTWLYSYLGMVPLGIVTMPGSMPAYDEALKNFLESHGYGEAWQSFPGPETVDIVYADGHTGGLLMQEGRCRSYMEISLPSENYTSFIPQSIMGVSGAMYLLEETMKNLRGILCR
ncbi:MAG: hypothetical protein LUQ71_10710 [Methanoregula sp.]|nr:hypothetical protein [Methanoregula sp.]